MDEITNKEIKMTLEAALKKLTENRFGTRAMGIVSAAASRPVNPYDHFGHSIRRSWGYAYFRRLWMAGIIQLTEAPKGRRGTHWYILAD
jgi:hypothetical protein